MLIKSYDTQYKANFTNRQTFFLNACLDYNMFDLNKLLFILRFRKITDSRIADSVEKPDLD